MTGGQEPNASRGAPVAFTGVQFGLGLTQLGRKWGVRAADVPDDASAEQLLEFAVAAGIRAFDTAPSYGASEERLGAFLRKLAPATRSSCVIMTKCGEEWDASSGQATVDHRYDALAASVDRSLGRLGRIDVLQIHRSRAEVLQSDDVRRIAERVRALGIATLGASVSDMECARIAVEELGMTVVQFPYSHGNAYMEGAFELASRAGCAVVVNRPLAMGRHAQPLRVHDGAAADAILAAYRFVLAPRFDGIVLTGTASRAHLAMDLECFGRASLGRGR